MPILVLTEAQAQAAMEAADSDLRYLLSEVGVAEEVQVALFHRGYVSLRLFSGMDETRAEVRTALNDEIGLDHTAGNVERRNTALVLSAWETARTQQKSNDENRAEARASIVPRPGQRACNAQGGLGEPDRATAALRSICKEPHCGEVGRYRNQHAEAGGPQGRGLGRGWRGGPASR